MLLPASAIQNEVLVLNALNPDSNNANVGGILKLKIALNKERFLSALNECTLQSDVFRISILEKEGVFYNQLNDSPCTEIQENDFSASTDPHQEAAQWYGNVVWSKPFLLTENLMVFTLLKLSEHEYWVACKFHHGLFDGYSFMIFAEMFADLYSGRKLTVEPSSFLDAVMAQQQLADSDKARKALSYWVELYANRENRIFSPRGHLTADNCHTRSMASFTQEIAVDRFLQWKEFAASKNTSVQNLILVALKCLFSAFYRKKECFIGVTTHGRTSRTKQTLGAFATYLPVLLEFDDTLSLVDALSQVKTQLKRSYRNASVANSEISRHVLEAGEDSRLFDVSINEFSFDCESDWGDGTGEAEPFYTTQPLPLDLFWRHTVNSHKAELLVSFLPDYFERSELETLVSCLNRLLDTYCTRQIDCLADLALTSELDKKQLLHLHGSENKLPPVAIHDLFEFWVDSSPEKVALVDPICGRQWTYQMLEEQTNSLANFLRGQGNWTNQNLVGIYLDHSAEMLISIIGVLKAGGAYLPLDSSFPVDRLSYMVADAAISLLITSSRLSNTLSCKQVLIIDETKQWRTYPDSRPPVAVSSDDLAYVIYTSGSTGKPKGVQIEHGGVCNLASTFCDEYGQSEDDRVLQFSSWGFDMSVESWAGALCNGATLVLRDKRCKEDGEYFWKFCEQNCITGMHLPTSYWQYLVAECLSGIPGCIKWINITGESVNPKYLDDWFYFAEHKALPRLLNAYGPTEVTITATLAHVKDNRNTIGRPLTNVKAYVLDHHFRYLPNGVVGELYLGGVQVARGYLGDDKKTSSVFIDSPFDAGERLYATGDLVSWSPHGELAYHGRKDDQIQIRGFRVEPGEIESVLSAHVQIRESVVLAVDGTHGMQLVAYVTRADSADEDDVLLSKLRAYCAEQLPEYMVPASVMILEAMPLTPSGKVDRKALSGLKVAYTQTMYEAPQGEYEQKIASIWRQLLNVERVGREDNFFHLGGHSLLATRFISMLRKELNAEITLSSVFQTPCLKEFAQLTTDADKTGLPSIQSRTWTEGEAAPLSYTQNRLWFIDQLNPGGSEYLMPGALRVKGVLSEAAFNHAIHGVLQRHEVLRTMYVQSDNGDVGQVVQPNRMQQIAVEEVSSEAEVQRVIAQEYASAIDLSTDTKLRVRLLRLSNQEHVAVFCLHHIASDGWSESILVREFAELYNASVEGRRSRLCELDLQYRDYATWQREVLQGDSLSSHLSYWKEALSELPLVHELPLDKPRPKERSHAGRSLHQRLSSKILSGLKALAEKHDATLFMVLNAALAELFSSYSGSEDIVIGTPIANREQSEVAGLIGFFVNTLVIRTDLSGDPTFGELIGRSKDTLLGAYEHQQMPFEILVDEINPERSGGHSPLFQLMLTMQTTEEVPLELTGLESERLKAEEIRAQFELSVDVLEGECLELEWNYATDLFEQTTITRMMSSFEMLVSTVINDDDVSCSKMYRISDIDQKFFNSCRPPVLVVAPDTVHGLFEARAAATPHKTALEDPVQGRRWSYRELNEISNRFAHHLASQDGLLAGGIVGLHLQHSAELMIAILGVLKAGCAYLPLDPAYPEDRLNHMVDDANICCIVTTERLQSRLATNCEQIYADNFIGLLQKYPVSSLNRYVSPEALAYVIYTSGSTGLPKGVMVEHGSVCNMVSAVTQAYGLSESDRILKFASWGFDISVEECFGTLCNGATLVLRDQRSVEGGRYFYEYCQKHEISAVSLPTAFWHYLVKDASDSLPTSLKKIIIGGEAVNAEYLGIWLEQKHRHGSSYPQLFNTYGPTEVTVTATVKEVNDCRNSIGRPLGNVIAYVLNKHLSLIPVGGIGELYLGGAQVARGYCSEENGSGSSFIQSPFDNDERLYRTGDLVRWQPDGELAYYGRVDEQLKIRGFRIEPEEIQRALISHKQVSDAVVVAGEHNAEQYLIAYVAAEPDARAHKQFINRLKLHCATVLPDYMVPAVMVVLDKLPVGPGGKTDRAALPAADFNQLRTSYEAPQTATEIKIADIWQKLLKLDRVGRDDSFFNLGGHSLLAASLISTIRSEFGVEVPVSSIFCEPALREFSGNVDRASQRLPEKIPTSDWNLAKTAPLSYTQSRLWFLDQLYPNGTEYLMPDAMRLDGEFDADAFDFAIRSILKRHEVLRTMLIPDEDGVPMQVVWPVRNDPIPVEQLESESAVQLIITQELATPFSFAEDEKLRVRLLRLNATVHFVVVCLHHVGGDGWSEGVFLTEFEELYSSVVEHREPRLPQLQIQYRDYAVWQRNIFTGDYLSAQMDYWKFVLTDLPTVHNLPLDYERPSVQSFRGASVEQSMGCEILAGARTLADKYDASLFMVLNVVTAVVFYRYSHVDDIVFGSPIANREQPEVEDLIGFFVNTVLIRNDLSGNPSYSELIKQSRETLLGAYRHQLIPLEMLVDELQPERSTAFNPLFQVLLTMQNNLEVDMNLPGIEWSRLDMIEDNAQFDIALDLREESSTGLHLEWNYATDLFSKEAISGMAASFELVLLAMINDDSARVSTLALPRADSASLQREHRCVAATADREDSVLEYHAPEDGVEKIIADIWQEVLQVERIGREDNFMRLGGNSFLAMKVLAKLKRAGCNAPLKEFYNAPTLVALARVTVMDEDF